MEQCPVCKSRDIRSHFDISIQPDGDYYSSCGVCGWTNHPVSKGNSVSGAHEAVAFSEHEQDRTE
jgi:hypothetical protein